MTTDNQAIVALIAKLEALTGENTLMDTLIENACGLAKFDRDPKVGFGDADYNRRTPKPYTASIDHALTLVPEGCSWSLESLLAMPHPFHAFVSSDAFLSVDEKRRGVQLGATPAIALCIAALKARTA